MSFHVLLNFIKRVGGKDQMRARMQDHMTLKSHFISKFALKRHDFAIRKRDVFMDVNA